MVRIIGAYGAVMTENNLRNRLFLYVMLILAAFLVPFEINNWADSALTLYGLCLLFIAGCLLIWSYWWLKSITRSEMFSMVGLLLVAIAINMVMSAYARWQFVFHPGSYDDLITTDVWAYRVGLELVILVWFFCWAVARCAQERTSTGKLTTYHNGIRREMGQMFDALDAKIIAGDLRFAGHTHDGTGLVLEAKIIIGNGLNAVMEVKETQ
jgi:hypothetical protein